MKKLLTIMLAMLMVLASGVSIFADEPASPDTKDTDVSYSVEAGYEWTQPADIVFDDAENGYIKTGDVTVTKAVIAGDEVLNIYINGDANGFYKIVSDEGAELTYDVKKDASSVSTGSIVLTVEAGETDLENNGVAELSFELTDPTAGDIAGEFAGICTFEAKLEPEN